MAKVAMPGSLTSSSRPFGGDASKVQAGAAVKRKTPSELRGEQLKRKYSVEVAEEPPAHLLGTEKNASGMVRGLKKLEVPKNPKYIDTRMDEVYPVRKSSNMFRMLSGKAKDDFSREQNNNSKNPSVRSDLAAKSQPQISCPDGSTTSSASAKDSTLKACQMTEKCSQNMFRTVAELSLGNEKSSGQPTLDMNTVLKGLRTREAPTTSQSPADSLEQRSDLPFVHSGRFPSEFQISGHKTPIDLTLKTTMWLVSSSSVNWCHRLTTRSTFYGTAQFMSQFGCSGNNPSHCDTSGLTSAEVLFSKALHSWVFPQSTLPPSVISALNLTSSHGELDFLLNRQLAWEDSFRGLYYMLRKSMCDIFYVCTSQFVVMFTGGHSGGKTKRSCNAYISQSTRGLRSLLREQDICFSMPLCHSEVEQATTEDLVELSEIGKCNLGQTRCLSSMSDVDNNPQSLLEFSGNESVHGLYDFLLNYRSFLSSLNGVDVPVIYSPVPFQNASLSAPEVKCKELKTVDAVASSLKGSSLEDGSNEDSAAGVCYSIEIKDTVLPPWTVCGLCAAMGMDGRSFEASFTNEPISVGLNVAFDTASQKSDPKMESEKSFPEDSHPFGVSEALVAPCLRSASLRGLKYSNGSYTASLSPV
ncbi:Donson [Macleaya cordata]|uniref:Donson n=1 Tax=Macleaya cordata TaxID=56857 RepID=A0A200PVY0_MACCD|nr:Donson [Macleaya cordata]